MGGGESRAKDQVTTELNPSYTARAGLRDGARAVAPRRA